MNSFLRIRLLGVARWLVWFMAAATAALAQQPLSPNRVTFYSEPNFKGESIVVEAGASVPSFARMTRANQQSWLFAISSVKIDGDARAMLYSGEGLSGQRVEIASSIADLYAVPRSGDPGATWDRSVAGVTVTGSRPIVVSPPPPPVQVETRPPTTVYVVPQRPPPPPPPPRYQYDRRAAETVVTRAYREVLGRNPDANGLRNYRDRLMREGWSEQQLIEQLQRSDEARGINADAAITRIYREVLGRDPDPAGLAHYRAKWRDGWTQGQIRDDLRRSDEARRRRR